MAGTPYATISSIPCICCHDPSGEIAQSNCCSPKWQLYALEEPLYSSSFQSTISIAT